MSDEKCNKVTFYAPSARIGGDVRPPSCVPDLKKQGQELREPTGAPVGAEPLQTPRAIILGNRVQIARCADREDGSEGYDVTVQEGTLLSSVPFSIILPASSSVLDYIARNNIVDRIEEEQRAGSLTKERLQELTLLPASLAALLYENIEISQERLNASAQTLANSRLVCEWYNTAQTATCPDPDMAHSYEVEGAVFTVTIAERTISSLVSQEEADRLAMTQASAALNCLYSSDPYTVTCLTRPDIPIGVTENVPNDTEPVYPGLLPRRGSVSLGKGAYTSAYSKEAANRQSETAALSMLNCYYVNNPVFLQCADPNARDQGIDPSVEEAHDADLVKRTPGQRVSIPKGFITSVLSTADADEQAQLLAESLLVCCFVNPEMTVTCKPTPKLDAYGVQEKDENGNLLYVPASETKSPKYSITVNVGQFTSCSSQEEVTKLAEDYATGLLQCYYCNALILPTCVPDWVVSAAKDGIMLEKDITVPVRDSNGEINSTKTYKAGTVYKLDLPLDPEVLVNPYTGEKEDTRNWSNNATVGASAESVCGVEYIQAQQVAMAIGDGLVSAARTSNIQTCYYGNDMLIAGCKFTDPYNSTSRLISSVERHIDEEVTSYASKASDNQHEVYFPNGYSTYEEKTTAEGTIYYVYQKDNGNISPEVSQPTIGASIVFPANLIQESAQSLADKGYPVEGYTEDAIRAYVKQQVNAEVVAMAAAMMTCLYGNDTIEIGCDYPGNKVNTGSYGTSWRFGKGKSLRNLAPFSPSSDRPIVFDRNVIVDKIYQRVYDKATILADSLLVCKYGNDFVHCRDQHPGCVNVSGNRSGHVYKLYDILKKPGHRDQTVAPMSFFADSIAEANNMARTICVTTSAIPCLYSNLKYECSCFTGLTTIPDTMELIEGVEEQIAKIDHIDQDTYINTDPAAIAAACAQECEVRCASLMWIVTNSEYDCICSEAKSLQWTRTKLYFTCAQVHVITEIHRYNPITFKIPRRLFIGTVKTVEEMLMHYCVLMCSQAKVLFEEQKIGDPIYITGGGSVSSF